ncbi:hypothetical protein [Streptomyces sp. NRRL S-920]|uniref:hypothetical protein n=1 Tax=Streptomyces sp. NRRL S-920 TaxID=1463921 RepID=UPI0004C7B164|nr:hypothetical protein [Streptomyces sp. NRRL S-920]
MTALACLKLGNGRRLVLSGDENGVIRYWSTRRKPPRAPFARRRTPVRALAATQLETGPALAAAWADGLVRIWDIGSDAVTGLRLGTGITSLGLDTDGMLRVTDADGTSVLRLDRRRDAQLAAVREALPALRYLHDDPESSIRWAANELERNCAASPA